MGKGDVWKVDVRWVTVYKSYDIIPVIRLSFKDMISYKGFSSPSNQLLGKFAQVRVQTSQKIVDLDSEILKT